MKCVGNEVRGVLSRTKQGAVQQSPERLQN